MTKNTKTKNYEICTAQELKNMAKELGIKNWWTMKKAELIEALEALDKVKEAEAEAKKAEAKPKAEKKEKVDKEEKNLDNIVTLKELAMKYNIKPSKARRILREANIERPYKRWEWDQEEHDKILTEVVVLLGGGQEEE